MENDKVNRKEKVMLGTLLKSLNIIYIKFRSQIAQMTKCLLNDKKTRKKLEKKRNEEETFSLLQ